METPSGTQGVTSGSISRVDYFKMKKTQGGSEYYKQLPEQYMNLKLRQALYFYIAYTILSFSRN